MPEQGNKIFKDPVSGFTHLGGAFLAIAGMTILIVFSAMQGKVWHVVSFSIFGAGMVLLYGASALYHLPNYSERANSVMRNLDHAMIYILIAGSFTPICLVALRNWMGWTLFGIVWAVAATGIPVQFIPQFLKKVPRWFYTGVYVSMGLLSLLVVKPLVARVGWPFIFWIVGGGALYIIGAIIYTLKKPNFGKHFGFHELFHIFILAGTILHYFGMLFYILPLP